MALRVRTPLLANPYVAPTIGSTSATVDLDFINGVYQVSGSSVALSAALASTGSLTTDANGLICDGSTKFNLTGTALTNALGRGVLVVEVAAGTDNHYIFGEIGTDSFANDVMVGVETTTSDFVFARVQNSGGETKSYDTVPFSTSTTYRAAMYLNGTAATFAAAWNGAHYWSPGLGLSSSPTDVYIGAGKNFGAFNLTGSVRRVFFVPQTADTPQSQLEAISVVGATTAPAGSVNTLSPGSGSLTITGQSPQLSMKLSPGSGALTISGQSPQLTMKLSPGTGSLAITGQTALIGGVTSVSPGTGTLTFTGQAPALTTFLSPGTSALTISGQSPQLRMSLSPGSGALTITGQLATVSIVVNGSNNLFPGSGTLTINGQAPLISGIRSLKSPTVRVRYLS